MAGREAIALHCAICCANGYGMYLARDRKLDILYGFPTSAKGPEIDEWKRDAESAVSCRN